jgi:small subunit ribosomal protein S11
MSEVEEVIQYKWGVAHIFSSYNNTLVHITDISGAETIAFSSGGRHVTATDMNHLRTRNEICSSRSGYCKNQRYQRFAYKSKSCWRRRTTNSRTGAQAAIRALARAGFRIGRIDDVTPIPHDTTEENLVAEEGRRV